jgi:hypothetical protein
MDSFAAEMMAQEHQRAIRADIAALRQSPAPGADWPRRALAAGLAALARWLDPFGAGQVAGTMPAPHR